MMRPVLVFVSFGVAAQEAREKSLAPLVSELEIAFPRFSVVEAYTSAFIRRRLKASGIDMLSLEECLAKLCGKGVREVYVQPALLTPGEEYENKILKEAEPFYARFAVLRIGEPIFFRCDGTENDDIVRGLAAISSEIVTAKDEAAVLMGHGSPHRHNPVYALLQQRADEEGKSLYIGVLEETDTPNFATVLDRLRKSGKKRVLLAPLLLTGGRHVTEDMAGDAPASWKSRLQRAGFSVRIAMQTLGERAAFRRLYIEKVRHLIEDN